jgi:hypothetical protein
VSAVILAVIVVMWAVVLVPMWLRRHDAATESRSVDRFSTAMRVLSRRSSASADRRYVLMPKRESRTEVHVSGAAAPRRPASRPATLAPPARPSARPAGRPSLAVRRRRVLVAIGGVTLLTFILLLAGVISWPFQFVVDLVLVAFVVHLRTQAKRSAAVARQRRRAAAVPAPAAAARPRYLPMAAGVVAAETAPVVATDEVPGASWFDVEPAEQPAATGTDAADGAWEPVPVPPPTYTMKPKAPPRRSWSPPATQPAAAGTHDDDEAATTDTGAVASAASDELDGILEHRRAVND